MSTLTDLKWQTLSLLMQSAGRLSDGIALGYRAGFDSGEMLDYVYENWARGKTPIGRAIDRVYLDAIGWRAIRARKALLQTVLTEAIDRVAAETGPVRLLDVAAGPGRYLTELAASGDPRFQPERLQILCRDLDPRGLAAGRRRAAALGLTNIRYERGDAIDPASLATVDPRPAIVVVSGLYELFVDTAPIERSLRAIHELLPPGGRLIFTTQISHPQLELIRNVLVNRDGEPWVMVCRSVAEAETLARSAGFEVVESRREPVGLFCVTVGRRPAG